MSKLKGCRPSEICNQDYINTCADLGDAHAAIRRQTKRIPELEKRQDELRLEVQEALKQEAKLKEKTQPEVLPPAQETSQEEVQNVVQ